jgi:hypothetical protein
LVGHGLDYAPGFTKELTTLWVADDRMDATELGRHLILLMSSQGAAQLLPVSRSIAKQGSRGTTVLVDTWRCQNARSRRSNSLQPTSRDAAGVGCGVLRLLRMAVSGGVMT